MKCKATVRSIMKAGPCYSATQIKSLFRKLNVTVITPKMVANLKLGNKTCMERDDNQCRCAGCIRDSIIKIQDRLWGLLNCFDLRAKAIQQFVFPELLQLLKKLWPEAPDVVTSYLKTGKGRKAAVGDEFLKLGRDDSTSVQRFMGGQAYNLILGEAYYVKTSAYILLKMCADNKVHSTAWHVKKLAKLCSDQR
jgi:hypothetical protein